MRGGAAKPPHRPNRQGCYGCEVPPPSASIRRRMASSCSANKPPWVRNSASSWSGSAGAGGTGAACPTRNTGRVVHVAPAAATAAVAQPKGELGRRVGVPGPVIAGTPAGAAAGTWAGPHWSCAISSWHGIHPFPNAVIPCSDHLARNRSTFTSPAEPACGRPGSLSQAAPRSTGNLRPA